MKRLFSVADEMRGLITYDLGNQRFLTVPARDVQEYGLAEVLRQYGVSVEPSTARLPLMQRGKVVGTLPANFEPAAIRSRSFFYEPRPGDFRREGDAWIASSSLGPGDLEAIPDFASAT